MKVLLLHQHFRTPQKGGALRSYYVARALADWGYRTIVITTHNERSYRVEIHDGLEVHYLPIPYDNKFGFYRRSSSFFRFAFAAIRLGRRFREASLCYAISVPLTVGIAAMALKAFYKMPYVFEVGDLWPEAPVSLGFIRNKYVIKTLYLLEKKIYKHASCIVALSEPIQQSILSKVAGKEVVVIENMADTKFFQPSTKDSCLTAKFNILSDLVVSYIGAIGYANGLDFFLACAEESQKQNLSIQFFLCGTGAMLRDLRIKAQNLKLTNLTFLPFQNRDNVRDLLNVTDASFVCYRGESILETGSPNKYFDALAAGKLIIINFGGWIKKEIELEKCGVDVRSPEDFTYAISGFLRNSELLEEYQSNARRLAEKRYARIDLAEKISNIAKKHCRKSV